MKLTIFLTIMFLILLGGALTTGYYAPTVPLLEVFQKPLMLLSIITGALAGLCILIKLIKEIKGVFTNGKESDKAE